MSQATGQIIASVGSATVTVVGASAAALSASTIIVATGGAAALALTGYGLYRWLANDNAPQLLPNGSYARLPRAEIKQLM